MTPEQCEHLEFHAAVEVNRMEDLDPLGFHLDLSVRCVDCGRPFLFNVPRGGWIWNDATVNIDASTMSVPIYPAGGRVPDAPGFTRSGPLLPAEIPDA